MRSECQAKLINKIERRKKIGFWLGLTRRRTRVKWVEGQQEEEVTNKYLEEAAATSSQKQIFKYGSIYVWYPVTFKWQIIAVHQETESKSTMDNDALVVVVGRWFNCVVFLLEMARVTVRSQRMGRSPHKGALDGRQVAVAQRRWSATPRRGQVQWTQLGIFVPPGIVDPEGRLAQDGVIQEEMRSPQPIGHPATRPKERAVCSVRRYLTKCCSANLTHLPNSVELDAPKVLHSDQLCLAWHAPICMHINRCNWKSNENLTARMPRAHIGPLMLHVIVLNFAHQIIVFHDITFVGSVSFIDQDRTKGYC